MNDKKQKIDCFYDKVKKLSLRLQMKDLETQEMQMMERLKNTLG